MADSPPDEKDLLEELAGLRNDIRVLAGALRLVLVAQQYTFDDDDRKYLDTTLEELGEIEWG